MKDLSTNTRDDTIITPRSSRRKVFNMLIFGFVMFGLGIFACWVWTGAYHSSKRLELGRRFDGFSFPEGHWINSGWIHDGRLFLPADEEVQKLFHFSQQIDGG